MQVFFTESTEQTERLGAAIAHQLHPGDVLTLDGDLGAGKTALSRGIIHALGHVGRVTSPTFALVNEYSLGDVTVCHFDMYRILDEEALYDIGWQDYLDEQHILLIEWSENIASALPEHVISIHLYGTDQTDQRKITIEGMEPLAFPVA